MVAASFRACRQSHFRETLRQHTIAASVCCFQGMFVLMAFWILDGSKRRLAVCKDNHPSLCHPTSPSTIKETSLDDFQRHLDGSQFGCIYCGYAIYFHVTVLTRFPDIRLPQLPPDSRSRRCKTAAARLQRFLLDVEHPCTRSTLADYLYEIVSAMVCCNAICDYFLHIIEQFAVSSR